MTTSAIASLSAAELRAAIAEQRPALEQLRQRHATTPEGHATERAQLAEAITALEASLAEHGEALAAIIAQRLDSLSTTAESWLRGAYREHARAIRDGLREQVHGPAREYRELATELEALGHGALSNDLRFPGATGRSTLLQWDVQLPDLDSIVPFWGRISGPDRARMQGSPLTADEIAAQQAL